MFKHFCAALLVFVAGLSPLKAEAARVSPMVVEMEPTGRSSTARISVYNEASRTVPFEVMMVRAEISIDGELAVEPADEDFLVFPTQVLLEGGQQQVFRIQYVGEPELAQSQIYYMSIRQVPVEFEDDGVAQVQVVVNYNVLVNVVPPGANAEPVVRTIEPALRMTTATPQAELPEMGSEPPIEPVAEGGEADSHASSAVASNDNDAVAEEESPGVEVLVGNTGNRYFLAGFSTWQISGRNLDGSEFEATFRPGEIARHIGAGVVGPGKDRLFFLPLEETVDRSSIAIEIDP